MMKRTFIRGLFSVVAALFVVSATAAGKVEVIGDTSHGTVTSTANGAVVTVTITPAEGYYLRKSDITATKSFMPMAAPRRSSIPIADELTLVGADPEDLSQTRSYTITLPGEEYDVLLDVKYFTRNAITESMVSLSETVFVYNEQIQRPTVIVRGLTENKDYTVIYSNPNSLATGDYTVTVKGRSAWSGTITRTYKIFAGGKAEVNNSITGGTIATAVDGLTVTLTVTPADGYYIRKQDLALVKTYMPVAVQKRSVPVADQLQLTGEDPDDLSLPRTYTAQLPGWEYSVYVDATFTQRQPITSAMVTLSASSFVYNGSDQKPVVTVSGLTVGKNYLLDFAGTSWSDVGTYSLTVTGRSTWKGVVTKTYTITKAPSVVTLAPEPLSLTYTGASQTLIAAGDATGGTLLYSLDNSSYKTALPTGTAAGAHTVYYKVQGDSNHQDTEVETVTVTIAKKAITISGITAQDKVYDGTTAATLGYGQVVYGGIVSGDNLTVTAKGAFANANVGTGKNVTISELALGGTSIANYQLAESGQQTTATATITPRSIQGAVLSDIVAQTYTGQPQTPAVSVTLDGTVLTAGTDYSVTYTNNVNVGEATLTVTGIGNYQSSVQATFAIVPTMAQVITAPAGRTLVYNGMNQELVTAGEADGGTLVYSLDGTTYAAALPLGKMVNSYTISYKVQGDANHNDTEPVTIESTINKAAITISGITAQNKVYDGTTVVTLGYDQVVYGGIATGDNLTVTAKGAFVDANAGTGKNVTITELTLGGTSIANYQLAETGQQTTATATITPRSIEGAVLSDIVAQTFTGQPLTPAVSVTLDGTILTAGTDYSVAYTNNVNVGEATLIVTGIGNYQGSVQTTFVITQIAASVITAPQPQTLVYSSEAQQLVTAGEAEGGTMAYSLDGTAYQEAIPTGIDAGSYTVYYKVVGDSNHADSESASVSVTIAPKEVLQPTILLSTTNYTYDGTAKEPDVTVMDGEAVIAVSEYTVGYANNINAGEATVTITDKEGGNYMVNGSASFTIGKVPSVITQEPQPLALDHTGEAQTLVVAGEAEGGTLVYSLDGETFNAELPNGTEAGVYTISYKVQGDSNHSDTEVFTLKSSITPTLVDESGTEVDADFVESESGDIEVVINTLPDDFWEDPSTIPSTVSDEKGNEYDVTQINAEAFEEMPSDIIVVLPEGMSTTEGVTNVVNGDGTCETLDLTDVSDLNLPIDVEVETVVYEREVTGGSTTVCLPYELPIPENTTAYVLDNTDSEGITLKECEGVLEANQPYVLVVEEADNARRVGDDASSVINLGASNVTISHAAEEGSVVKNNFTLCGTVHSMTHEEGLEKKAYIMQPDNSWRMTASSDPAMAKEQYLAPFQAYLLYTGEGELAEVTTNFESSTTGVLTVKPSNTPSSKDGWYDMNGRKLNGKPTRKGAYLHRGKVTIF
jgi:hypothetical protein